MFKHSSPGRSLLNDLVEDEAITEGFANKLLARYIIRNPFSLEKIEHKTKQGVMVYRSKLHATLKRNFQIRPGTVWLKLLLQHVPDHSEHLVRYYCWYSNRSRGDHIRGEWSPGILYKRLIIDRCVPIRPFIKHEKPRQSKS